jgi:hypothetical protein
MFSLERVRESKLWRATSDLSTLAWLIGLVVGVVLAIGAWLNHQPFYVSILCFLAAVVLSLAAIHYGLQLRQWIRKGKEKTSASPAAPPPNLVFQTLQMGGRSLENGVWSQGGGPNAQRYIAWVAPIKNEYRPEKPVGRARGIKAEIILSVGGQILRQWSPAVWVGEKSKVIEIPVAETKELIMAFRSSAALGYWEMDFEGIPMGNRVGELKVRLLMEDDSGTTSHLVTKRYRWKRAPELLDFYVEPLD